jgi:hypothetical protein
VCLRAAIRKRGAGFISCLVVTLLATTCSVTPPPLPPLQCGPSAAPEVLSVIAHNVAATDLHDYPVAIAFDKTNFDFNLPSQDGSNVTAWNAVTGEQFSSWLESYNPQIGKGVMWVKLKLLAQQSSQTIWLTGGAIPNCALSSNSGYEVFPFFSDVHDLQKWQSAKALTLSNTVMVGPLVVDNRQVIESDGMYNSTPGVVTAGNGDWVLAYRKGIGHSNSPLVILRRSQDQGKSWSPEVAYFDTSKPDPTLALTPKGDLLIEFVKQDLNGNLGAAYSRSTDNGITWAPFQFFDQPVSNTSAFPGAFVNVGTTIYAASYGPSTVGSGFSPFLWFSNDDGFTWTKLSELRKQGETGFNETAITQTGPSQLLAVSRTDDSLDTYARRSDDMGLTWGPLISLGSQVGAIHMPQLILVGPALVLLGREALGIPGVLPQNTIGYPRQLVAFVSYDNGQTFQYGTVLDTYTGEQIDGAYSWPMLMPDGKVFVVYYADSHNLRQPDIKSLRLSVTKPVTSPSNALHLVTQLASVQTTHPLGVNTSRYSLDFRLRSFPTPAGSQFAVSLQGQQAGQAVDLVRWELPSTRAADPTAGSGFIANGQFVQVLDTFAYNQSYRVRTVVDQLQGIQQAFTFDDFGTVVTSSAPQSFAQGSTVNPVALTIGNGTTLRATDVLLDFVFLRPAAEIEPQITISRIR